MTRTGNQRAGYQGIWWFKCDLQMQTPADRRHWSEDGIIADAEGAERSRPRMASVAYGPRGGQDRRDVRDAVLDLMEGSAAACRRRGEKYGF